MRRGYFKVVDAQDSPDEVEIARVVASGMSRQRFYTRQEMELVARESLKENEMASGERAARYAVSYVQKYLGDKVKNHNVPGKNTWYYLADNEMKRPWDKES